MPSRYGFDVSIVDGRDSVPDQERRAWKEYDTKTLGSQRTVTTKIESRTNAQFMIRVRPIGPFLSSPLDVQGPTKSTNGDTEMLGDESVSGSNLSSPLDVTDNNLDELAPYSLGILVYIDGNVKSEVDILIRKISSSSRSTLLRGRTVVTTINADGVPNIATRGWMFGEVGIEVQLNRLQISGDSNDAAGDNSSKRGQIEVRLDRCIRVGENTNLSEKLVGSNTTVSRVGTYDPDATHDVRLIGSPTKDCSLKAQTTRPYIKGEKVFATYIFQYMDRKKLTKLGLCKEIGRKPLKTPDTMAVAGDWGKGKKREAEQTVEDLEDEAKVKDEDEMMRDAAGPRAVMVFRPQGGP